MHPQAICVVGGSAGAVEGVIRLLRALPKTHAGALLIALHRGPSSFSNLRGVVARSAQLEVEEPVGRVPLQAGKLYLAAGDHQMLVEPDTVRGVRGPHENRQRPAIDPLFRSAAAAFGSRVIAVLLSGAGNDGTIGLWHVRDGGGVTVVQADALFREMPESAARMVQVEHSLALDSIAPVVARFLEREDRKAHR